MPTCVKPGMSAESLAILLGSRHGELRHGSPWNAFERNDPRALLLPRSIKCAAASFSMASFASARNCRKRPIHLRTSHNSTAANTFGSFRNSSTMHHARGLFAAARGRAAGERARPNTLQRPHSGRAAPSVDVEELRTASARPPRSEPACSSGRDGGEQGRRALAFVWA